MRIIHNLHYAQSENSYRPDKLMWQSQAWLLPIKTNKTALLNTFLDKTDSTHLSLCWSLLSPPFGHSKVNIGSCGSFEDTRAGKGSDHCHLVELFVRNVELLSFSPWTRCRRCLAVAEEQEEQLLIGVFSIWYFVGIYLTRSIDSFTKSIYSVPLGILARKTAHMYVDWFINGRLKRRLFS